MSGSNPLPAGVAAILPPLAAGSLAMGSAWGSGQAASNARPLRGAPASYVRQPFLGSPPAVQLCTGFGNGSGAGIRSQGSDADQSQGLIAIVVGLAPAASGTLQLKIAASPPSGGTTLFCDWATLTPNVFTGLTWTIAWTATRPLVTGELLLIAYQWTISQ